MGIFSWLRGSSKVAPEQLIKRGSPAFLDASSNFADACVATANDTSMNNEGFPDEIVQKFLAVADSLDIIILSRAPGGAGSTLIREGYDLKSFFVKAKSCNWGPMAGFLCSEGCFNKSGADNRDWNLQEIQHYQDYLNDWSKIEPSAKPGGVVPGKEINPENTNDLHDITGFPFRQIEISPARKSEILDKAPTTPLIVSSNPPAGMNRFGIVNYKNVGDSIYGLARDKNENAGDSSVWVIFRLINNLTTFRLHVCGCWYKYKKDDNTPAQWKKMLITEKNEAKGLHAKAQSDPDLDQNVNTEDVYEHIASTYNSISGDIVLSQHPPIMGLTNPFPAYYSKSTDAYKNTVSGDYDLFSVWPISKVEQLQNYVRVTEAYEDITTETPFFIKNKAKSFSVESVNSRGLFIELVPDLKYIGALEDKSYGNYNSITLYAAGILNSLIFDEMEKEAKKLNPGKKFRFPNRSFHSDEAGRPGIDEVDYPVGVFLPESIRQYLKKADVNIPATKNPRVLLIKKDVQLLSLLFLVRGKCMMSINESWFVQWAALSLPQNKREAILSKSNDPNKKWSKTISKVVAKTPEQEVSQIRNLVYEIFRGKISLTIDNKILPLKVSGTALEEGWQNTVLNILQYRGTKDLKEVATKEEKIAKAHSERDEKIIAFSNFVTDPL